MTLAEFIKFLRQQHRAVVDYKEESTYFNVAVFDPPAGADGYRRKEHFKMSSFIVLDFDNGTLSPRDFERIFWRDAGRGQKRSFIMCNSYSRSPELPNKFRVILPYQRPSTSLAQHEAVYDAIVARLEANDFTADLAKLDRASRSGVQSFFLPCTNRKHQESAFFVTRGIKTRDLQRCAIDPMAFGKTTAAPLSRSRTLAANTNSTAITLTPHMIDAATEKLRSMTEGRHDEAFKAGMNLARLGLSEQEIEAELH